jgi:hypothetical protein
MESQYVYNIGSLNNSTYTVETVFLKATAPLHFTRFQFIAQCLNQLLHFTLLDSSL